MSDRIPQPAVFSHGGGLVSVFAATSATSSTTDTRLYNRNRENFAQKLHSSHPASLISHSFAAAGATAGTTSSAAIPPIEAVEEEKARLDRRKRYRRTLITTIAALVVVAAVAVLIATLLLPVLQVSGTSMEPTLEDGDVVVLANTSSFDTGDLVGFYYQNKLLLKRVIGAPGDVIDIDEAGNVTVNGTLLEEDYVTNKSLGSCDITFPYQVPESHYFVLGDNRTTSIDSRTSAIGCIEKDQFIGKVMLRVWPLDRLSTI